MEPYLNQLKPYIGFSVKSQILYNLDADLAEGIAHLATFDNASRVHIIKENSLSSIVNAFEHYLGMFFYHFLISRDAHSYNLFLLQYTSFAEICHLIFGKYVL